MPVSIVPIRPSIVLKRGLLPKLFDITIWIHILDSLLAIRYETDDRINHRVADGPLAKQLSSRA